MKPYYREFPPPSTLAHVVDAFWCLSAPQTTTQVALPRHRVFPDGCVDLFFRFHRPAVGGGIDAPVLMVYGPTARFELVELDSSIQFVGVRFKPGAAVPVLEFSPLSLVDQTVMAQDCSGHLIHLSDKLCECYSPQQALSLLEKTVLERMAALRHENSVRVRAALKLLSTSNGSLRISDVAERLGVTETTLRRDITGAVGLSPKVLARILRFQRTLTRLRASEPADLCTIALDNGYADQSHMGREFQELAGITPTAFMQSLAQ